MPECGELSCFARPIGLAVIGATPAADGPDADEQVIGQRLRWIFRRRSHQPNLRGKRGNTRPSIVGPRFLLPLDDSQTMPHSGQPCKRVLECAKCCAESVDLAQDCVQTIPGISRCLAAALPHGAAASPWKPLKSFETCCKSPRHKIGYPSDSRWLAKR
jgi:hypothetical protein